MFINREGSTTSVLRGFGTEGGLNKQHFHLWEAISFFLWVETTGGGEALKNMHGVPDVGAIQITLRVLNVAKSAYPAILLVIFLGAFVFHGIRSAPYDGDTVTIDPMRGPGGRPLPLRRKSANQVKAAAAVKELPPGAKTFFKLTQAGVALTFLVNAGILLFQVLLNRKDEWWPGKNAVVCYA